MHEIYDFEQPDGSTNFIEQKLLALAPVCKSYHAAAHLTAIWRLETQTKYERAVRKKEISDDPIEQLREINGWSMS